ncbi:hypothetical protein [uncultured Sphingomonas sp.]|uniref:hypothetical protein n=1 Tax=uncultured Sphingomonas sp. TaxID=158754 RepID=UPI0025DF0837|nr:hypothetical protein [uncultured Sphingomonas sp.]
MFTMRTYLKELAAGMGLYLALLAATIVAVHRWPVHGGTLIVLLLVPMIGIAAVAVAVLRGLWRMDEMQRRIQMDAIAISFLVTAVVTLGWGFAQLGGAPRLHPFAVWPIMAVSWMAGLPIARRRFR